MSFIKVALYTLGCKVNSYETEAVAAKFIEKNFQRVPFDDIADVYIINTCSVTNMADAKSRKMIRRAHKLNPNAFVGVMGCYSQVKPDEVSKLPGVNVIIGNNNKKEMVEYILGQKVNELLIDVKDILQEKDYEKLSNFDFEHTRAFLKIEDGCDNFCSYCIIPYTRGPVRCKAKADVLKEIQEIVFKGYKEVVLAGIHTGRYYSDNTNLSSLIDEIIKSIVGLKRLRLSSIEINEIDDKLISLLQEKKILVNHLHLPLQSGSDKILKLMNRKYDLEYFRQKIKKIKEVCCDASITTDVIVGFPYETEEDFIDCVNFINEMEFSALHVFPYSKRSNTLASSMPQVNDSIKDKRTKILINLSKDLEIAFANKFLNKKLDIIIESTYKQYLLGHTSNYLKVLIENNGEEIGSQVNVIIDSFEYPYCFGHVIL